jgi:ADP-heptose:LPS heptosyltransferase
MRFISDRGDNKLRFLDRSLGIPIVFILGCLRFKKKVIPPNPKKIGILNTAAIGDTILMSAAIIDIKKAYPNSYITLFCGPSNFEIAQLIGKIDKTIKLKISNPIASIKKIKEQGSFDLWIDFGPWPRLNSVLTFFAKADYKIGFKTKGQARHFVYDKCAIHSDKVHELENIRNITRSIGIETNSEPLLNVDLKTKSSNNILIHIFPGGYKSFIKEWPQQNWIKVIDYLTKDGYTVLLTGVLKDRDIVQNLIQQTQNQDKTINLAGNLSLEQCAEKILQARLVISVNTGIMHLASVLKQNLIVLNGPTSVKRWGPLNVNAISLKGDLSCSPCLDLGFEYGCKENKCMKSISTEQVINAINKFLKINF